MMIGFARPHWRDTPLPSGAWHLTPVVRGWLPAAMIERSRFGKSATLRMSRGRGEPALTLSGNVSAPCQGFIAVQFMTLHGVSKQVSWQLLVLMMACVYLRKIPTLTAIRPFSPCLSTYPRLTIKM
uniref:Uncharacterized protein n=1 Tax=Anguilla anguilla TaxID=7936 RepID=A0A0E9WSP5_ANGAN